MALESAHPPKESFLKTDGDEPSQECDLEDGEIEDDDCTEENVAQTTAEAPKPAVNTPTWSSPSQSTKNVQKSPPRGSIREKKRSSRSSASTSYHRERSRISPPPPEDDDWAGNVEKAIQMALKGDKNNEKSKTPPPSIKERSRSPLNLNFLDEDDRKNRKKRKKKHKDDEEEKKEFKKRKSAQRTEKIVEETEDDDEMLFVRGASPTIKNPSNDIDRINRRDDMFPDDELYESYSEESQEGKIKRRRTSSPSRRRNDRDRSLERDRSKVSRLSSSKRRGNGRGGGGSSRGRLSDTKRNKLNRKEVKGKRSSVKRMNRIDRERGPDNVCMFFMQGKCQKVKGMECPYSHDVLPPRKLELCKFYLMDCCAKKEKCLYMHNDFPCKYFHTGLECFAGDRCKFSHNQLSETMKNVLLKEFPNLPLAPLKRSCDDSTTFNPITDLGSLSPISQSSLIFEDETCKSFGEHFHLGWHLQHLESAPKDILGDFSRMPRDGSAGGQSGGANSCTGRKGKNNNNRREGESEPTEDGEEASSRTTPMPGDSGEESEGGDNMGNDVANNKSSDQNAAYHDKNFADQLDRLRQNRNRERERSNRYESRHSYSNEPFSYYRSEMDQDERHRDRDIREPNHRESINRSKDRDRDRDSRERHIRGDMHDFDFREGTNNWDSKNKERQTEFMHINHNQDNRQYSRNSPPASMGDIDERVLVPASHSISTELNSMPVHHRTRRSTEHDDEDSDDGLKIDTGHDDIQQEEEINHSETYNPAQEIKQEFSNNSVSANSDDNETIPSHLPKKQRELYLRIRHQQREADNNDQNKKGEEDEPESKEEENWYSSDEEENNLADVLKKMNSDEKPPPAQTTNQNLLGKIDLGDLSKINISESVTKLLTSMRNQTNTQVNQQDDISNQSTTSSTQLNNSSTDNDLKVTPRVSTPPPVPAPARDPRLVNRDPRQQRSTTASSPPREGNSGNVERRRRSNNTESSFSIYSSISLGVDVDLRSNLARERDIDLRKQDTDFRSTHQLYGDTDLRVSRPEPEALDVDLRKVLGLPFKPVPQHTPCTEIDASIGSHPHIPYKVYEISIPRPDYSGLRLNTSDPSVRNDPRLRKLFKIEETTTNSPSSPPLSQQAPTPRIDPRTEPRADPRGDPRRARRTEEVPVVDPVEQSQIQLQSQVAQITPAQQSMGMMNMPMMMPTMANMPNMSNMPISNNMMGNMMNMNMPANMCNNMMGPMPNQQMPSNSNMMNNFDMIMPPMGGGDFIPPNGGNCHVPVSGPGPIYDDMEQTEQEMRPYFQKRGGGRGGGGNRRGRNWRGNSGSSRRNRFNDFNQRSQRPYSPPINEF